MALPLPLLLVLAAPAPTGSSRCQPAAGHALVQRATAARALARRDYHAANAALDAALATLGDAYGTPELNDDTGLHLALAAGRQRQGQWKPAAEIKARVLDERLHLCGQAARR